VFFTNNNKKNSGLFSRCPDIKNAFRRPRAYPWCFISVFFRKSQAIRMLAVPSDADCISFAKHHVVKAAVRHFARSDAAGNKVAARFVAGLDKSVTLLVRPSHIDAQRVANLVLVERTAVHLALHNFRFETFHKLHLLF